MQNRRQMLRAICIGLLMTLAACVQIPETGKSVMLLTSTAEENKLGADGYREVLKKSKVNRDPKTNEILRRVGTRIARASGRTDFKWEFNVIESKEQNAWCMPGGKIAVYTGILPAMVNEAGMATVLGHEVAHATLRHAGQRISQEMLLGMGLSVAQLGVGSGESGRMLMGLLGAGAQFGVVMPYGRGQETEADLIGLKYMAEAGYDPHESVTFWTRFKQKSGGAPPEFLSTHPATLTRIRNLQLNLPEASRIYQASANKLGSGEVFAPAPPITVTPIPKSAVQNEPDPAERYKRRR